MPFRRRLCHAWHQEFYIPIFNHLFCIIFEKTTVVTKKVIINKDIIKTSDIGKYPVLKNVETLL